MSEGICSEQNEQGEVQREEERKGLEVRREGIPLERKLKGESMAAAWRRRRRSGGIGDGVRDGGKRKEAGFGGRLGRGLPPKLVGWTRTLNGSACFKSSQAPGPFLPMRFTVDPNYTNKNVKNFFK